MKTPDTLNDSTAMTEDAVDNSAAPENYLTHEEQVKIAKLLEPLAKVIEKRLAKAAGKPVPFSLFTWGGDRAQYIANVEKDDAMRAMGELLNNWINQMELGAPGEEQEDTEN